MKFFIEAQWVLKGPTKLLYVRSGLLGFVKSRAAYAVRIGYNSLTFFWVRMWGLPKKEKGDEEGLEANDYDRRSSKVGYFKSSFRQDPKKKKRKRVIVS